MRDEGRDRCVITDAKSRDCMQIGKRSNEAEDSPDLRGAGWTLGRKAEEMPV